MEKLIVATFSLGVATILFTLFGPVEAVLGPVLGVSTLSFADRVSSR
jgi:hypothetical protein